METFRIVSVLFDYPPDCDPIFYSNLDGEQKKNVSCLKFNSQLPETQKELEQYGGISLYSKFWYFKIVKLLDFLKTVKEEKILFLDALDTNIISPLEEIMEKYDRSNKKIIFGAEWDLWPPTKYSDLYKNKPKSGPMYLNSGTYIGDRNYIIRCLQLIIDEGIENLKDDQGAWTWIYLLDDNVDIDNEMNLFFTTHKNKTNVMHDNIIVPEACIIHDNGPSSKETIKLNSIYESMCPMPPKTRGNLIPMKYKKMRQRPEEWMNGSSGLYELIEQVNLHFHKKTYSMLEIGSYFGESTVLFMKYGNIKQIYCVDPYINGYDPSDSSSNRLDMNEVKKIFYRNVVNRFSTVKHIEKESLSLQSADAKDIDFIYVDGNHNIDYVEKEIKHLIEIFSPKIIAGHDYNMVGTAINKILGKPDNVYSDYSWIKVL